MPISSVPPLKCNVPFINIKVQSFYTLPWNNVHFGNHYTNTKTDLTLLKYLNKNSKSVMECNHILFATKTWSWLECMTLCTLRGLGEEKERKSTWKDPWMTTALSLTILNSSWLTSDSYNLWPRHTLAFKQDMGSSCSKWQKCFATVHANKTYKSEAKY